MNCAANNLTRTEVLGIRLDRIDLAGVLVRITEACTSRKPLQIVTVNLNFITLATRKVPTFSDVINNAGLAVVDGRILLWVTRLQQEPAPEQITGHDLFHASISRAAEMGWSVFLVGGAPGVGREVADLSRKKYPTLRIAADDGGLFSEDGVAERQEELNAVIREFRPELLFVALGAPKQDMWIARNLTGLEVPVAIGVGSVFDVVAGHISRAPRWVQVAGLESPYQLLQAPRRYARRYLIDDPPTLARVAFDILRKRLGK